MTRKCVYTYIYTHTYIHTHIYIYIYIYIYIIRGPLNAHVVRMSWPWGPGRRRHAHDMRSWPLLGPSWAPKKGTRGPQEGPKRGPRGPKKQQKIKRNLSPTKKRFLLNFSAFAAIRGYLPPHLPLGIPRTTTNVRDDERRTTANGQRRRRRRTAKNQWKINDFCLLAFWLPMAIRGLKMAPRWLQDGPTTTATHDMRHLYSLSPCPIPLLPPPLSGFWGLFASQYSPVLLFLLSAQRGPACRADR